MTANSADAQGAEPLLAPYLPRLLARWLHETPERRHRVVDGTLAFLDISGFTRLTERLARKGRVGAEEMSDALNSTFAELLAVAYAEAADLVKWGGDALLLLFQGDGHAERAGRAAFQMRRTLSEVGRIETSSGPVRLRMSVGIHSGAFHFFLVGDPAGHRELLVGGPQVTTAVEMEAAASAGEIALSAATAELLDPGVVQATDGGTILLRREPRAAAVPESVADPVAKAGSDWSLALPAQIRAHLSRPGTEPEHRPVAVAFVRYSGTDALLADGGPEMLAEALDEVVRNVQDAADTYDVTFFESDIDRDGGKIMLTAGAPRSSGNDVEHLLRCARAIIERPGTLAVQVGINDGHVFAGDFGPPFRRTYSVKGDAVNLAARLTAKAQPGEVLATAQVVGHSGTQFETRELPPFAAKGKSAPVHALAVGPALGRRTVDPADVLLIGRDGELETLLAGVAEAKRRDGQLIDIVGEEGVGKSRLAAEALGRARPDMVVLSGTCDEYESRTAYFPFRELLRALLGIPAGADPEAAASRLRDRVEANAPEMLAWLPLLGLPMDLSLPATRETAQLDEEFRKRRLEDLVCEFLRVVQPTAAVFFFEDAHLMDEASADLIRRLSLELPGMPWLLLLTRRDARTGFVPEPAEWHRTMYLGPLKPQAAITLAEIATDAAPLPPQALELLAGRAGGNPLFLRELVAAASRTGAIDDLPDSLEQLVVHRIDDLAPQNRTVLRYASVLGVSFSESLLMRMLPPDLRDSRAILTLRSGFLQRDGSGDLRFRHALLRDVAYEGLAYRQRRVLHALAGDTIEAGLDQPETQPEALSWHFFQAGEYRQAWKYSRLAGKRARAKYAHIEAAGFFQRAADSGRRAEVHAEELAGVMESLGDVRYLVGQARQAGDAYRAARRLVPDLAVRAAQLSLKEARLLQRLGRYPQALRSLTRGLHSLDGVESPDALAIRSLLETRYAICRVSQGRYRDAAKWGRTAIHDAQTADDSPALAQAYLAMHTVDLWSGEPEDLPYGKSALALFEELDDAAGQAHCLNNLAMRALFEGQWTESLEMFRRAADGFHRVGDAANAANATYNVADVLLRQGHWAESEQLLKDARRVARAVGDEELVALCLRESGRAASRATREAAAMALFADARSRFTELGEPHEIVDTDAAIAECLLLQGEWDQARELATDALARAESLGAAQILPTLRRIRGVALLRCGRGDQARAELEMGLRQSESPDVRHERGFLLVEMAYALSSTGDPGAAKLADEGESLLHSLGVVRRPAAGLRPAGVAYGWLAYGWLARTSTAKSR